MRDNTKQYKCPADKRYIRKFDLQDRNRFLVAIPFVEYTSGRVEPFLDVARPGKIFDWLHENCRNDWFVTTSFVFPKYAFMVSLNRRALLRRHCMLVSMSSCEDATLFAVSQDGVVALPQEWWLLFENESFKSHPLFPEFALTEDCLARKNGQIIDEDRWSSVRIERSFGGSGELFRTIRELAEDTWFRQPVAIGGCKFEEAKDGQL